jgi:hypothetical protein
VGRARANTAEDHCTVLDSALQQSAAKQTESIAMVGRADSASATREFAAHYREGTVFLWAMS